MSEILLPTSVEAAREGGTAALIQAAAALPRVDERLLTLWTLHAAGTDAEFGRIAAIWCVQHPCSIATAIRLWLMEHDYTDIGVANTLLGALERDIVAERCWPTALTGAVVDFLRRCLKTSAPSIRVAVLSVLRLAAENDALPHSVPTQYALWLATALEGSLDEILDDDERVDLAFVQDALRAPTNIGVLPLSPRALQRVILDLLDAQEALADVVGPLDSLVDLVRRRHLLDDAGRQALRGRTPVQTLRVMSDRASTRVVQAFVSYGEAIVGVTQDPDFSEVDAPDYGTQVGWAPAASVPFHLFFGADESRRAFEVLEALVGVRGAAERRALFESLEPTVAEAVLRFLKRLVPRDDKDVQIEIVLTDPESSSWQRSVVLGADAIAPITLRELARRARADEPGGRVAIAKNHVPQANTVHQVFQAVDAMRLRGTVIVEDIDDITTQRQVDYYKHGARTLGLFDEDNLPTGRADALVGLTEQKRLALTAVFFEDSPVGRAWRTWSGKTRLRDVDPTTAKAFLEACAVGLTGTTPARRASTLRAWYDELMPHYPD